MLSISIFSAAFVSPTVVSVKTRESLFQSGFIGTVVVFSEVGVGSMVILSGELDFGIVGEIEFTGG